MALEISNADPFPGVAWDARAELDLALFIKRYLHENRPPAGSRLVADLADYAELLRSDGERRLDALHARRLRAATAAGVTIEGPVT